MQRCNNDIGYGIFLGKCVIKDINSNRLLPPFEKGELLINSRYNMNGYLDKGTDKDIFIVIDRKKYLRTGDIGYLDADGLFYYVDRLKRMVRIGGHSVFPAAIENTIMGNRDIINCIVARKKDKNDKPFLTAYLQTNPSKNFDKVIDNIKANILENLGKYNVPRKFIIVDEMAKTSSGKNNYRYYENLED
jgi:acyl-CoA synthetase (AMP-forming)/AMP-acid ligase II